MNRRGSGRGIAPFSQDTAVIPLSSSAKISTIAVIVLRLVKPTLCSGYSSFKKICSSAGFGVSFRTEFKMC